MPTYRNLEVDVSLMYFNVHNACNAKIQELQGGRSRYKLVVSLRFTAPLYRDTQIEGWTFTLQTDSVLAVHNAYGTKI